MNSYPIVQVATKNSITKQIVFPKKLIELVNIKLDRLGLQLPEYIRHLIVKDVEDLEDIPMVDEETEAAIGRSLKEYEEGNYTTLHSLEEIESHFKKLAKEARAKK